MYSGCAASRAVSFTSEPPGAMVTISPKIKGETPCLLKVPVSEQKATLSLPTGEHREICLKGGGDDPDNGTGYTSHLGLKAVRAASTICTFVGAPLILAGVAGIWLVDRTSGENDVNDIFSDHQTLEITLFSISALLVGAILYNTGQNLDDMSPPPESPEQVHIIFSEPAPDSSESPK